MLKLMIAGRRAPGTTRASALAHLRDVHGRMVVSPPPGAGAMPRDYVQNHVFDGAYPGSGAHAIDRDLVTELWFDDLDGLRAATSTPYYLGNLKPDEPRFVDEGCVAKMMVDPVRRRDGEATRFKAFFFIASASADGQQACDSAIASLAHHEGVAAIIENQVKSFPGATSRFVDFVLEAWFATAEQARAAASSIPQLLDDIAGTDPARSFAVAAEEFTTDRLRTLHASA